jgi:hypothetical protein
MLKVFYFVEKFNFYFKQRYNKFLILFSQVDHNNDLRDLVERIEQLEFQLHSFSTTSDYKKVDDLHSKVKDLCQKLEVYTYYAYVY